MLRAGLPVRELVAPGSLFLDREPAALNRRLPDVGVVGPLVLFPDLDVLVAADVVRPELHRAEQETSVSPFRPASRLRPATGLRKETALPPSFRKAVTDRIAQLAGGSTSSALNGGEL